MYDAIIIGAGIVGVAIARELAKYEGKICVLEKEVDIAMGTSKANSAIVHAGFDAKPNTLKAKLNVLGNSMFDSLSKELSFEFKRNGSLVLCFDLKDADKLIELKEQGLENGVQDIQILNSEELRIIEPNISEGVVLALYAPSGGIVCPYGMAIALAENAFENGVEFYFNNKVLNIIAQGNGYKVITDHGSYEGKTIINAAGLFSDDINNMISKNKFTILPRRGEYCVFDKNIGSMITKTVFQLPTKLGKGVLVTPTVDGNLIIGPNAVEVDQKEDMKTTNKGIEDIIDKAKLSIKAIPLNYIINSFAGLRARTKTDDFIIGEALDARGFINVAGIESPGLTSAPAIAVMVREIINNLLHLEVKKHFKGKRKGILKFRELTIEEKEIAIRANPKYGNIICRCETITEGEIIDAINRPLGATTMDGVKIRTRSGMGRCQGGFCSTRVLEILSKALGVNETEITKFGGNSKILLLKNKEEII